MASRHLMIVVMVSIVLGCAFQRKPVAAPIARHIISPYQQFIARNIDWSTIHRIVLMPVANQTAYPTIPTEIQTNLAAELQRAGNFEIVAAHREDANMRAQDVFASGQFNEIEAVRVAREYQADAILFVNVTQYHPYKPPRLGLSLLMISPAEGIAIASLSGFWDSREAQTLDLAQAYLRQNQNWPRSLMAQDRVVEMPDVFQRFVCQQVASTFYPHPSAPMVIQAQNASATIPADATIPAEPPLPFATEIPPVPPSPAELNPP